MQTQTPSVAIPSATDRRLDPSKPGPSSIYQALVNQRDVLSDQLASLENQRSELNTELQRGNVQGVSRAGVERRITGIDDRIADVEKQIAGVDRQVSEVAAVPGAIQPPVIVQRNGPPEELYILGMVFTLVVLLPFAIAMARRVWKQTSSAAAAIPSELMARLARIEQAVDTSAVEIERIGEGQRFITKLFSDSKVPALPASKDRNS